jgi:hypothetical protein
MKVAATTRKKLCIPICRAILRRDASEIPSVME